MSEKNEQIAIVTTLSVISLSFGILGMLGSFIPCLGSLAIVIALPATIIGAIGVFVANKKNTPKEFAIAATVLSAIGLVVSGVQTFAMFGASAAMSKSMYEASKARAIVQDSTK
ncbi:MAG: hypothetical protein IPN71_23135 [Fibrobacteres bacterium]|nr:hypothetical protein [Fibrobacterota bacterium]